MCRLAVVVLSCVGVSNCVTSGSGGVVLCRCESSNCVPSGSGGADLCGHQHDGGGRPEPQYCGAAGDVG